MQSKNASDSQPADILKTARYWATSPAFDQNTRAEIASLIETNALKELDERFYRDLEFGTGGMRGILGAGTNRMNVYNIRKATTAFARYLLATFPEAKAGEIKIAISYDSRRFSRKFAETTAQTCAAHGIAAYLTKELRPTPMVSFMVRHFGCKGGVCVTASHNPPNYNGYKVYWNTGGQIIPPHDEAVIARYLAIKNYEDLPLMDYEDAKAKGLIIDVGNEFDEIYFKKVAALTLRNNGRENFKIVFTPLHGTGAYPVKECLRRFGFSNVLVVPEQEKPDENFPTVKFPNPEDPAALEMALNLAKKTGADLVLATDPDTDRIGFIVKEENDFTFFNGNQIGCLLVEYYLDALKCTGKLPKSPMIIKTVVTTDMQADIALFHGATCEETLTGFKWICQLIEDFETGVKKPYAEYVCGGEESYGFLAGKFVRDKDAVSACCIAAEMVAWYKSQGQTMSQVLERLFVRHGVYQESLYNLTLPGKDGAIAIKSMMNRMRQTPPTSIDGSKVAMIRDFEKREVLIPSGNGFTRKETLNFPTSDVLQFILVDGTKVSVRPSGTEAKIKFYVSVKDPHGVGASVQTIAAIRTACVARTKRIESIFVSMAQQNS